jgi:hypothetical protein
MRTEAEDPLDLFQKCHVPRYMLFVFQNHSLAHLLCMTPILCLMIVMTPPNEQESYMFPMLDTMHITDDRSPSPLTKRTV